MVKQPLSDHGYYNTDNTTLIPSDVIKIERSPVNTYLNDSFYVSVYYVQTDNNIIHGSCSQVSVF